MKARIAVFAGVAAVLTAVIVITTVSWGSAHRPTANPQTANPQMAIDTTEEKVSVADGTSGSQTWNLTLIKSTDTATGESLDCMQVVLRVSMVDAAADQGQASDILHCPDVLSVGYVIRSESTFLFGLGSQKVAAVRAVVRGGRTYQARMIDRATASPARAWVLEIPNETVGIKRDGSMTSITKLTQVIAVDAQGKSLGNFWD